MSLTRRGRLLLFGAFVLSAAGRALGLVELFVLAAVAVALVGAAAAWVRFTRFSLEARRQLRPPKVPALSDSRVDVVVRNTGPRRSPVLLARDPFDGGRRLARLLVAPLAPGESAKAAYRLPTERRGVFALGPLELELRDPFGLAVRGIEVAPATALTVFPHVDPVDAMPVTRGDDSYTTARHGTALAAAGEDFYALREYVVGDDLRRVHWKSTAKLDEPMIRQDELPWHGRVAVLLDLRARAHDAESLEVAISAAASIASASWRRGSPVRLLTTGGVDTGFGTSREHLDTILEQLARAGADTAANLGPLLAVLARDRRSSAFAVVTTGSAGTDVEAAARIAPAGTPGAFVVVERYGSLAAPGGPHAPAAGPVSVVHVRRGEPFARAWNAVIGAASTRVRVGR